MAQYSKKQLSPLINKYGIDPEKDKTFIKIIEMFDNQSPYQIWAITAIYGNKIPIQYIEAFRQFAIENQTLIQKLSKKNLVSYKTKDDIAMLQKEILGLQRLTLLNDEINRFNTNQRRILRDNIFNGVEPSAIDAYTSSNIKKYYDVFFKFSKTSNSRKHNIITTASAINDFSYLMKHIADGLNKTYDWNKDDLLGFVATNDKCKDVKVIYNRGNIVVLEIPNYDASHTLCHGRTSWCLTRSKDYFSQYVTSKQGNRQFFYFDFSKPETDQLAHVGFTVSPTQGIVNAHSTQNNDMRQNSGFTYNGRTMTINTVLENAGIKQTLFIHLNGINGFKWDMESILDFITKNNEISVCINKNGRLIVRVHTKNAFKKLLGNTLVQSDRLTFDEKNGGAIYAILDTNVSPDDEISMITMQISKDEYGFMSIKQMMNAYAADITNQKHLNKIGVLASEFINQEKIKPSVLLHKYIDDKNENDAIRLINENPNELDVNYLFNSNAPIYKAIDNNMLGLFDALVKSPKFDSSVMDSIGEPILQSLIYEYADKVSSRENVDGVKNMIDSILGSETYDFNARNINLDTAVNVAAGFDCTNWILEELVKRPNVDVNVVNDVNCAAFGEAVRRGNINGAKILLKRSDINITDNDKKLLKDKGISLDSLKPTTDSIIDVSANQSNLKDISSKLVEAFASALSMRK